MTKKLTITIDGEVYDGLYRVVGPRKISQFIEQLLRPHVMDLNEAYREMSMDQAREKEALIWSEASIHDLNDTNDQAW